MSDSYAVATTTAGLAAIWDRATSQCVRVFNGRGYDWLLDVQGSLAVFWRFDENGKAPFTSLDLSRADSQIERLVNEEPDNTSCMFGGLLYIFCRAAGRCVVYNAHTKERVREIALPSDVMAERSLLKTARMVQGELVWFGPRVGKAERVCCLNPGSGEFRIVELNLPDWANHVYVSADGKKLVATRGRKSGSAHTVCETVTYNLK